MQIFGRPSGPAIGWIGLVVLAALAGLPASAPGDEAGANAVNVGLPELSGTAWLLEDLGGRGVLDGVRSTLGFRRDGDGGVYGSGGCNRYNGSITLEAGRLQFGPLASTRRMCPPALMGQEQRFFEALAQTASFERRGSLLVALDGEGADLMRLTPLEGEA